MIGPKLNKHPKKIISLKEGIERLVKQIQKEELNKIKNEFSKAMKEQQEDISDIKTDIEFIKKSINDASSKESMKRTKTKASDSLYRENPKIKDLIGKLDDIKENKEKIDSLEDELVKIKNEQLSLKEMFGNIDNFKDNLKKISAFNKSAEDFLKRLKKIESDLSALKTKMHNIEKNFFTELDLLKRNAEENKEFRADQLQKDIEVLRQDLNSIKKKLLESENLTALNDKLREIEEEIKSVKFSTPVVIE